MIRFVLWAVLALSICVTPTKAQTQFFWQVHTGGVWLNAETPGIPDVKGDGVVGGVGLGVNYWLNRTTFLRLIGDVTFGDVKGCVKDGNYLSYCGNTDFQATLVPRIGFVASDWLVVSAGAGLALARNTASVKCAAGAVPGSICSFTPAGFTATSQKETVYGWTAVVGFEVPMPQLRAALFTDLSYTDYGKERYMVPTPLGNFTAESHQKGAGLKVGIRGLF